MTKFSKQKKDKIRTSSVITEVIVANFFMVDANFDQTKARQ